MAPLEQEGPEERQQTDNQENEIAQLSPQKQKSDDKAPGDAKPPL